MINLDKSENWSSWEDWVNTKKVHYGSKTGLQVYGGIIDFDPEKQGQYGECGHSSHHRV